MPHMRALLHFRAMPDSTVYWSGADCVCRGIFGRGLESPAVLPNLPYQSNASCDVGPVVRGVLALVICEC